MYKRAVSTPYSTVKDGGKKIKIRHQRCNSHTLK